MAVEEWLVDLFERLRKLAIDQNPLEGSKISGPQLALLDWVAATPGCGIQDIAAGLGLSAPTVSVSVRRLEELGLLERQPNPQDGRAIRLFLTAQGRALYARAQAFRRQKMRHLLAGLTDEEKATFLSLLEKALTEAERSS